MTQRKRRNHSPGFKANVAMAAIRGDKTLAELAQHYDVPPNQIQDWKQRLLSQAKRWFEHGSAHAGTEGEAKVQSLHAKLGALTMARDVLSKALGRDR
jgi:transposase